MQRGHMRVLAVIPAYNEEECLADTVRELTATCPDVDYLVVNDGSADRTPQICDSLQLNHVDMPVNCGLASGVRAGMKYALRHGYDAAVQYDADGQHVPTHINTMRQKMEETGCDIVLGSRYLAGEKAQGLRNLGSKIIAGLIRLTTHVTVTDPTCGMRMYNRRMIEIFANGFDIEPEPDTLALLIKNGATTQEVPISVRERQGGESYLKPLRAARYMLRTCSSLVLFLWFR